MKQRLYIQTKVENFVAIDNHKRKIFCTADFVNRAISKNFFNSKY